MNPYNSPILNDHDTATYLAIPPSTLGRWRADETIHSVTPERRGWPRIPFVGVVEAFVLRALRGKFPMHKIREAAQGVRKEFNDPYGLARPGIVWDAAGIFIEIGGEYYRAHDRQQAVRQTLNNMESLITWSGNDPQRLRLLHFGENVILDPRFGWGRPVVESNKVPVEAIMGMWRGGDAIKTIAANYEMAAGDVQRLIQRYDRARDTAA